MIQFIATPGAVLKGPELARRVDAGALQVAVTVAPDRLVDPGLPDERIVLRDGAVGIDAHDLADAGREVLHQRSLIEAVTGGDEEGAVLAEGDPRAVVVPAPDLGALAVDDLDLGQGAAVEAAARDRRSGRAALARLRKAQVDGLVLGELRVDGDVEQAALALKEDRRRAGDRRRERAVLGDDSAAGPARSVTIIWPSGRKARPHGFSSPVATRSARSTPVVLAGVGDLIDGVWAPRQAAPRRAASESEAMRTDMGGSKGKATDEFNRAGRTANRASL